MRATLLTLLLGTFAVVAAEPAATETKPTAFTLQDPNAVLGAAAQEFTKSAAGVTVNVERLEIRKAKCPAAFSGVPFWTALETVADQTNTRIALRNRGRTVVLEPRPKDREISAVSGPFRIVPRMVRSRLFVGDGTPHYEVQLEVHWEPRMPVYRIDTYPKITKATDDRGTKLDVEQSNTSVHPEAGAMTEMWVRLSGLTRDSKQIAVLAGEFRATVAEQMLAIRFDNLQDGKVTKDEGGVKATLKSFTKSEKTWDVDLELRYPSSQPRFDSYEEQKWLRDNRVQLIAPDKKVLDPESWEASASGPNVSATYRFKTDQTPTTKGWALVCDTPGVLKEVKVPFELKNIPLP